MNAAADLPCLAVVTGAAHRLGKAIALELARHGYAIGLHYHTAQTEAVATAGELRAAGCAVELLPADLTNPAEVAALFSRVEGLPYRLKVLVNSAGVMARGDLRALTVEDWDATLALNLRAPWLCAREAARRMPEGGVIVNLSDSGVHKTWDAYPVYAISKSGLEVLTRLLARSLAPGIRVNAVAPGLILPSAQTSADDWQRLVNRLPLKQAGTPQDVARAVWFLVENEYLTGETIVVDGGYQLV
jgi:NAD(P)-dependent dehydrogenase (short-subunit alcohol dehydrogenase family)